MLKEVFKPEVLELIELRNWTALRDVLGDWPAPEVADLLEHLRKQDRVLLFRALSRDLAADVFAYLDLDQQNALLTDLTDEEARQILADLPPDDRAMLLDELPGQVTQRVLNLLSPGDLGEARLLLGYPEESVGRLMTPDYVAVRRDWTVEQTLRHIRTHGKDRETINRLYVIDDRWRLLDDIELRKVILADPATAIEQLMDHSFASVSAFADREEAVRMIRRYDIVALPVVASGDVLVGIVTVDDLLDVAEQEATEDFHRVGSVEPIRRSFREAGIGYLYRRRIGWLLALVVVNILSGAGIAHFEDTISATLALIFFLPLLIASAGNAGAQASTLTVRALATGDVKMGNWLLLLGKELAVATALAVTMAGAVSLIGVYRGGWDLGVVVALTMVIVVVLGSLVGMSLPFLLDRFGLDPATASAPLVTSIADIVGVLVYLSIATWYLGV